MGAEFGSVLQATGVKPQLERLLVGALPNQRWFRSKAREIAAVHLVDACSLPMGVLAIIDVAFRSGLDECYCLPLTLAKSRAAAEAQHLPIMFAAGAESPDVFCDPLADRQFADALLDLIAGGETLSSARGGTLVGTRGTHFAELRGDSPALPAKSVGAEQSNTSVIYGDRLILKLFRRLEEGVNPEVEIGVYLTDETDFRYSPAVAGTLEYHRPGRPAASVAVLQSLVANHGDAWTHTLAMLDGYFKQLPAGSDVTAVENIELARQLVESYRPDTELLGRRTAELHDALAANTLNPHFQPEPFDALSAAALSAAGQQELHDTLALLASRLGGLSARDAELAQQVLGSEAKLSGLFEAILSRPITGQKIRCHGDYHLGQVLFTGTDFVILDFEGEPARPLAERRAKQSPLKDVAGMLRSFDYAVAVAVRSALAENPALDANVLATWARPWRTRVCAAYLGGYEKQLRGASFMPATPEEFSLLLDIHVLEKTIYELRYELNNRPLWVEIPLAAIAGLGK